MQRVTITLDEALLAEIDRMVAAHGYQNRSEAIRDMTRAGLAQTVEDAAVQSKACVAALVYVYDHAARELARRLVQSFHDHHELSVATTHVHLDRDTCMEVTLLKGLKQEVRHFAEHVIAERGVRYGRLVIVPAELADRAQGHGEVPHRRQKHVHARRAAGPSRCVPSGRSSG